MLKNKWQAAGLAGLVFFFILGAVVWFSAQRLRQFAVLPVGDQSYNVVISQTPRHTTRGLSYRTSLGADGMLFLFPSEQTPVFWMYEMHFPLDFIWIRNDIVVSVDEQVPPPKDGQEIARVRPSEPVTAVLEVPAGFVRDKGIKIGTRVGRLTEFRWRVW